MMEENQPPASKYPPPVFPETENSERNHHDDLRLKDPKAVDWWLFRVAALICSEENPEAELAYRDHALSSGLRDELERAVLVYDIGTSTPSVQKNLAHDIVFLFLNLEKDHSSNGTQTWFESDQENLLESLQRALTVPTGEPPKRKKLDETQITSIFRGLLEGCGGRKDVHQHEFSEDYTGSDNADLCASLLGIIRKNQFGDFDPEAMRSTLSNSPLFSGVTISEQDLEQWTTKMRDRLRLGFPERYLRSRIDAQPHQNAIVDLSQIKTPELGGESDHDRIIFKQSNTLSLQGCSQRPSETIPSPVDSEISTEQSCGRNPLQGTVIDMIKACTLPRATEEDEKSSYIAATSSPIIHPHQYRLVRLSNIASNNILEILCTKVLTMNEVHHIEELIDGSWELLVHDAQCARLEVTFSKMLPGWDVDLIYDPEDPTMDDLKHWNYATAKQLRQSWFRERARRVIKRNLYPAAAYYNYRLARTLNISIFDKDDTEPSDDSLGNGFPSMKDRIVQSATRENDRCALPASSHEVTGSVQDLPLCPTSIVDETVFEITMREMSHLKISGPTKDTDLDWVNGLDDSQRPCNDYGVLDVETRVPVGQRQHETRLEINITQTIEQFTVIATASEDMKTFQFTAISSPSYGRNLLSPEDLGADEEYTLIRLSKVDHQGLLDTLEKTFGTIQDVPNIDKLKDGSWVICVLKSYVLEAQDILHALYPDSEVDIYYDPFEPPGKDVQLRG